MDKLIKLNIPIIIAILTSALSALGYLYSIDKRVSLLEREDIYYDRQLEKVSEDIKNIGFRIEKIYQILTDR